jgi:NADH-quinone oxidoreductase subunit A
METLTPLAGVILLFLAVGIGFIFVHLVAGKFIRPNNPDAEKKTIYECGEPTIGSAWIQFDLRFYVVALLFVIFDVEVAFFFPWAEVFGRAQAVASATMPDDNDDEAQRAYGKMVNETIPPNPENAAKRQRYADLPKFLADLPPDKKNSEIGRRHQEFQNNHLAAQQLLWVALLEILVFFGVLLVGFAYLWKRGDLEWVRSTLAERPPPAQQSTPASAANGAVSVGAEVGGALAATGAGSQHDNLLGAH